MYLKKMIFSDGMYIARQKTVYKISLFFGLAINIDIALVPRVDIRKISP